MSYRDDEKRWKRIQDMLAAEASGRTIRPTVSQRTLFGIPSTMEQTIERIVEQDEKERRMKQREGQPQHIEHPLQPIFDERSRVLVLGSLPSPKSREVKFYYGHPQNRFWRVLAELFDEPVASTNDRRRDQLLRHHIALWDVIASCDIAGASDASITNAVPNDLSRVIGAAPIEAVFCTGAKAADLYTRLCEPSCGIPCVKLPSTSPANAAAKLGDLVEAYRQIVPHLHEPAPCTLDVADVVKLEQAIDASGTSLAELMDRAGTALAYRVHRAHPQSRVTILCGNGNNGGDGWVAARELAQWSHRVALITAREADSLKAQPAHDAACSVVAELEGSPVRIAVNPAADEVEALMADADVVIDALLGTGFAGSSVKAPFDTWIELANRRREQGARTFAADVPSGVNAQDGTASDPCIVADETVTMIVSKPGLESTSGKPLCGKVHVAPLAYFEPLLAC